jgi:Pyruvate/2-oxoacid:ferredoxin oxidoreductase delta subunit
MDLQYRKILLDDRQLGPYPLEKLPRADSPTTEYTGGIARRRQDESGMAKALSSDAGQKMLSSGVMFFDRDPLCSSLSSFQSYIAKFPLPETAAKKAPIPDDPRILSRHIKSLGYFLGADMIGICRLPQSAVFAEETEFDFKYAVVLLNAKRGYITRQSYGREWIDDPCSFQSYQRCACQAQVITSYLRRLGWRADSSIVEKYPTLMPQLVIESGLGEESRIGIALNPFVGASFKISAVLTDLPLECDKPIDFGIQAYCAGCRICAEQCPTQSISYGEKEEYNGYMKWKHDAVRCATGVITNQFGAICQRCTKVCPWNRCDSSPEVFRDWDGSIESLHSSARKTAESREACSFVEPEEKEEKWWFPLTKSAEGLAEGLEFNYDAHYKRMEMLLRKKQDEE